MILLMTDTRDKSCIAPLEKLGKVKHLTPDDATPEKGLISVATQLVLEHDFALAVVIVDSANGMNLCRSLRSACKQLPILWVSEDKDFAPEAGRILVEGFLTKPVLSMQLAQRAKEILVQARDPTGAYPNEKNDNGQPIKPKGTTVTAADTAASNGGKITTDEIYAI